MTGLKGWRTIGLGLLIAVLPSALSYLASVDWTHYVSPNIAMAIAGVAGIALRVFTTTPVGKGN